MVCPHRQVEKRVEPVRIFFGQGGRESIFRDFVRTTFMDGPSKPSLKWATNLKCFVAVQ